VIWQVNASGHSAELRLQLWLKLQQTSSLVQHVPAPAPAAPTAPQLTHLFYNVKGEL